MQKIVKPLINLVVAFTLVFYSAVVLASEKPEFGNIDLVVKGVELNVEYADTFELRNRGLMFRKTLCQQCGMLFHFGKERLAGMWMKNTLIPLDVAFIRKDGVITDIKGMQPHDLTSIGSSEPVLYALEMNQGWFEANKISVGDTVQIK